jgi:two-component system sensor histidine kinase/response regulator
MLTSFSFHVSCVNSGESALTELAKAAETHPYDLVLMDWNMPEMDGAETSKRLKQDLQISPSPHIIMLTAYDRGEIRQQAEGIGVEAFLSKPVTPSALFDTIMDVFGLDAARASQLQRDSLPESETLQRLRGAHILLVEDNPINQQVARELLESVGVVVNIANNGREAVGEILNQGFETLDFYDAILMDLQMPEIDGYEATRQIRELEHHQSTITNRQGLDARVISGVAGGMAGNPGTRGQRNEYETAV